MILAVLKLTESLHKNFQSIIYKFLLLTHIKKFILIIIIILLFNVKQFRYTMLLIILILIIFESVVFIN